MIRIFIFAILIIINLLAFAGWGWVYGKNKGYFKIAQNSIRSPKFFASDGSIVDIPTVSLYTTSIYGEYGITDRITAIAYIPFFVRSTLNKVEFNQSKTVIPGDEINSFGDSNIGLKYGFFQDKPVVLAASFMLGIPLGSSEVSSERILQTGDGEFNQLLKLEASHSFYPKPFYATATVGFNNRTNGFSDEFHAGIEAGITSNKLIGIVRLYNVSSLYNGDGGNSGSNGVFANNTEYLSFVPEVIFKASDKIGIAASGGFAFSGKQILAAPNWSFGVFMNL
jgi:hypothetical protein